MFICSSCKTTSLKWSGKCSNCWAWNTLEEIHSEVKKGKIKEKGAREVQKITFTQAKETRIQSSSQELDSVLWWGLSPGSLVLLSGEPGIGKSTLALQMSEWYGEKWKAVLYISGEEHAEQIFGRAQRLWVKNSNISILTESDFDNILPTIEQSEAEIIIIDSLSVLSSSSIEWSLGSIAQIRIMTEVCMNLAKKTKKSILLIGHITKDGSISGPKSLEHLVDVVLFLEGIRTENYRILRALKNRFWSTDNVGLFRMEESWLIDLPAPGLEFINSQADTLSWSALTLTMEGARPILVEIEALTTYTKFGYPKRSARGISLGKLELLIAVISKFTDTKLENYDVYINVARWLSLSEPGIDLACIAAIESSKNNSSLGKTLFLGEVSLTGVVKNVFLLEKRLKEAAKLGFSTVYIPSSYEGPLPDWLECIRIKNISDLKV